MKLKNIIIKDILLGIAGAISGFLSGMLGAGGGMVALFSLALLCPEEEARDRFAATICAVLPMTVVSSCFYLLRGGLLFSEAVPYLLPGAIGGLLGGLALGKLPMVWIRRALAAIMLISGLAMVFGL
ncbi:MAG TPA: TSUP family transporter [Clostridiales bacterium]|nr:TSUP family transporter [Clostridiales bacterium]